MNGRAGGRRGRRVFGAIDLGASSGRVVAGVLEGGPVALHVVHRFPTPSHAREGHLRWDLATITEQVLVGLTRLATAFPEVESVGIDTWGVDYALVDDEGVPRADPISHRDPRTDDAVRRVDARLSRAEHYAATGIQHLPFTTHYQLEADREGPHRDRAAHAVLLPDLLAFRLTGALRTETTNASTTGLLDARTGRWAAEVLRRLGLDDGLFPPLEEPGAVRGVLTPEVVLRTGLRPGTVVTTVASHDTASAVAAMPATGPDVAYASSGTWSLVGVESPRPVLTPAARAANFTNERGVDGRTRFLRNVGGLWLLQECVREWGVGGAGVAELLREADERPDGGPVVDVDDPAFIPPGGMTRRILAAVERADGIPPSSPAAVVRCVLDSLAAAYARTLTQAADLAGRRVETVHLLGGGSRNALLCDLVARRCGVPVVAGPAEATALGNVLVQARAHGCLPTDLEGLRAALADTPGLSRYAPDGLPVSPEPAGRVPGQGGG